MNRIIDAIEKDQFKTELPAFRVGDSIRVHTRVVEGDKERIQIFAGIVIGRKGRGLNENFTVRRISYGEGVERVFPLHSPRIAKVEVEKEGLGVLAGPVEAAAVILPEKFRHRKLKDSKQLLPELRQEIYDELVSREDIVWSIGVVDSFEIDQINILRATHKAMRFALEGL